MVEQPRIRRRNLVVSLVGVVIAGAVSLASGPSAHAQGESAIVISTRARFVSIRAHSSYRAWTNLNEDAALTQARSATNGPLSGQFVAVKDNIDLDWLPTSAGTATLRTRQPSRNATVVDRLLAAGAIIPGHTNMDTWARGVRTVSETLGSTANGRNARYGPMGSSGGTAVAIALGDADVGLGTDTCGSIRYPAAANFLYGLRPTPGLVSRSGIVPLSPTQDVVGPIAPTIAALARMLDVIAGPDMRDPLTATAPARSRTYIDLLTADDASAGATKKWRVGVVRTLGPFRVETTGRTMIDRLRDGGVEVVEVTLPALPNASVIDLESTATRALVKAGRDEQLWMTDPNNELVAELVTADTRRYHQLLSARRVVAQRLIATLDANRVDALAYPTTPHLPTLRGERQPSANCHLAATGGLPALALPHGMNTDNVPIPGIDLLGRPFDEATLLAIGQILTP